MDDHLKLKLNSPNQGKTQEKKSPKPPSNSIQPSVISNRSFSINGTRKKRSRHETLTKVTCSNCQAVSFYQIGDYVRCSECDGVRFNV